MAVAGISMKRSPDSGYRNHESAWSMNVGLRPST